MKPEYKLAIYFALLILVSGGFFLASGKKQHCRDRAYYKKVLKLFVGWPGLPEGTAEYYELYLRGSTLWVIKNSVKDRKFVRFHECKIIIDSSKGTMLFNGCEHELTDLELRLKNIIGLAPVKAPWVHSS